MTSAAPEEPSYPDYAFYIPVRQAEQGSLYGMYNSINPTPGLNNPTLNWLSIYNPGSELFSASVNVYRSDGTLERTVGVAISPGARDDIELGSPGGRQVTGIYEIVPASEDAVYGSFLARYSSRGDNYDLGFVLESSQGSCGETLPASSMNNATNWLELGNPTSSTQSVAVTVRDRDGVITYTQNLSIPGFRQENIHLNPRIDPQRTGDVGSVTVECEAGGRLLAQSAQYGHDTATSQQTTWAYASQALGAPRGRAQTRIVASANTFFRSANWLKLAHSGDTSILQSLTVYDAQGITRVQSTENIRALGTLDYDVHTPLGLSDRLGTLMAFSNDEASSLSGELLRVFYTPAGKVSSIMRTPTALVDPKVLANSSTVSVIENTPTAFEPTVSDRFSRPLSIVITTAPRHGTISGTGTQLIYTPATHYLGPDSMEFRAVSEGAESELALVSFSVAPRATQFAGDKNLLAPYRDTLTKEEVESLLKKLAFGGTPEQRAIRSLDQLINSLVDPVPHQAEIDNFESVNQARLSNARIDVAQSTRWFFGSVQAITHQALRYGNPFRSWMSYIFWHNHFANNLTGWSNSDNHFFQIDHINRLKRAAFGKFRETIFEMFADFPYHSYLDNQHNTYDNPVENLGREFLELHTAGTVDPVRKSANGAPLPSYTEADMETSTRALSGWSWGSGGSQGEGYRQNPSGTPPAPSGVQVTDGTFYINYTTYADRVRLTWLRPAPGLATYYRIYRRPLGISSWTLLQQVNPNLNYGSAYSDLTAVAGQLYEYTVRAVSPTNLESANSTIDTGYRGVLAGTPPAPTNVQATEAATAHPDRVRITWNSQSGVTGFRVYRKNYDGANSDQPISGILPPNATSFDDLRALPNRTYHYFVRSLGSNGQVSTLVDPWIDNDSQNVGHIYAPSSELLKPVGKPVVSQGTLSVAIRVNWAPVDGAASYRVFRGATYDKSSAFDQIMVAVSGYIPNQTLSFDDTTAQSGVYYAYRVIPYDSQNRSAASDTGSSFNAPSWNASSSNLERRTFLNQAGQAGQIASPGLAMSAFGESFQGTPNVLSFVDHVLYEWPATRRQLGANLFAQLAHGNLTEQLVSELGKQMLETDFDYAEMSKRILRSSAMFAPESQGRCVQNPVEIVFSTMRLLNLPLVNAHTYGAVSSMLNGAGYSLLNPPSVFGWTNCGLVRGGLVLDGSDWILSTQTYVSIGNGMSNLLKTIAEREGMSLFSLLIPTGVDRTNAQAVIDSIGARLGVRPNTAQRARLVQYLNTPTPSSPATPLWRGDANQVDRLSGLTRLLVMSEDFLKK